MSNKLRVLLGSTEGVVDVPYDVQWRSVSFMYGTRRVNMGGTSIWIGTHTHIRIMTSMVLHPDNRGDFPKNIFLLTKVLGSEDLAAIRKMIRLSNLYIANNRSGTSFSLRNDLHKSLRYRIVDSMFRILNKVSQ